MENIKREFSLDFARPRNPTLASLATPILDLSTPELNKMISGEELTILTPTGISAVLPQVASSQHHHQIPIPSHPSPMAPPTAHPPPLMQTSTANYYNTASSNYHNNLTYHNLSTNQTNNSFSSHNYSINSSHNNSSIICGQAGTKTKTKELDNDKIQKKRERNRLAARKCRQRKNERIEELEQKIKKLEMEFEQYKYNSSKEIETLVMENFKLKNLIK